MRKEIPRPGDTGTEDAAGWCGGGVFDGRDDWMGLCRLISTQFQLIGLTSPCPLYRILACTSTFSPAAGTSRAQ